MDMFLHRHADGSLTVAKGRCPTSHGWTAVTAFAVGGVSGSTWHARRRLVVLPGFSESHEPYFYFCAFSFTSGETSTQCGIFDFYLYAASAAARGHTADRYGRRKHGSHTNPTSSPGQFVPFCRPQGGQSFCSGPTSAKHQRWRRSAVCRVSLRDGWLALASCLTRHTQRPRHKKVIVDT